MTEPKDAIAACYRNANNCIGKVTENPDDPECPRCGGMVSYTKTVNEEFDFVDGRVLFRVSDTNYNFSCENDCNEIEEYDDSFIEELMDRLTTN